MSESLSMKKEPWYCQPPQVIKSNLIHILSQVAAWRGGYARRKFHEIHVVHQSPTTTGALARISALYAIEEEIRGKPADHRLNIRQTRAKPLLDELRTWMEKAQRSLSSKSETASAIRYALSRWRALTRYTEDGMLEIDNSAAERALRAVALGRKNYCSPDPIVAVSGLRLCTRSSAQPSSTGSIPSFTFAPSWLASPTTRSPKSRICCAGIWLLHSKASHHKLPKTHSSSVR